MTTTSFQKPDSEPTPEFNQRCIDLVNGWSSGELSFEQALAAVTALEKDAVASRHPANQGRAAHILGYLHHYHGNFAASIRWYERARALFDDVGNRRRAATMDLNQGENYRYKGDFNRARKYYRAAYEAAADLGILNVKTMAIGNEGQMLAAMGQHDDARDALEEAIRLTAVDGWEESPRDERSAILSEVYHALVRVHLAQGNLQGAWDCAHAAYQVSARTGDPLQLGFANRALAEVISAIGTSPDPAFSSDPDRYYSASAEHFRTGEVETEIARTMFAQGKSMAVRGRKTSAAKKLQQAMIIFTRLGMVDDAARAAEAQLTALGPSGA